MTQGMREKRQSPVKKPTILVLAIYVELYILLFYEPPFDRGGRIPVFVRKDPDCPCFLEQFNVVLRTVCLLYYVL